MDNVIGLLKVKIVRGVNLVSKDLTGGDPYVVLSMGDQKLKTSVKKNCLKPEWNEELTFAVSEPIKPIKLAMFDKDRFSKDDEMGTAVFNIQPLVDASKMNLIDVPNGVPIRKLQPMKDNNLARESPILLEARKLVQYMVVRLQNVKSGEVEMELRWVEVGSAGARCS